MPDHLRRWSFCVTGKLDDYDRAGAEAALARCGARIHANVRPDTNFLVVGARPGGVKLRAADRYGVHRVDEGDLRRALRGEPFTSYFGAGPRRTNTPAGAAPAPAPSRPPARTLLGWTIAVVGSLDGRPRDDVARALTQRGATIANNPGLGVDMIVLGDGGVNPQYLAAAQARDHWVLDGAAVAAIEAGRPTFRAYRAGAPEEGARTFALGRDGRYDLDDRETATPLRPRAGVEVQGALRAECLSLAELSNGEYDLRAIEASLDAAGVAYTYDHEYALGSRFAALPEGVYPDPHDAQREGAVDLAQDEDIVCLALGQFARLLAGLPCWALDSDGDDRLYTIVGGTLAWIGWASPTNPTGSRTGQGADSAAARLLPLLKPADAGLDLPIPADWRRAPAATATIGAAAAPDPDPAPVGRRDARAADPPAPRAGDYDRLLGAARAPRRARG